MITQLEIENVVSRIVAVCQPRRVILFGSYAAGTATEKSDLDLLVVTNQSREPRHRRARRVRQSLWGMTDVPKDILVYTENEINEWKNVEHSFIHSVLANGKTVYGIEGKADSKLAQ